MLWKLYDLWNLSLVEREERVYEPRNHIWASELGGAYVDRWLRMKGTKPSNPPNERSRRKFEAGNIWESIIGFVLLRAGILQHRQKRVTHQYPGLLEVTGRLDYIAGGKPDYGFAMATIQREFGWLPDFVFKGTENIVRGLAEKFPDGLPDIVFEVKSCSSRMFDIFDKYQRGHLHHELQNFHYIIGEKLPEGHVAYISKDDARLIEIGVYNPSDTEQLYYKDIADMTELMACKDRPEIEKAVVYDDRFLKKFKVNWKVEYSHYLTMLYHLKNQDEVDKIYGRQVQRWNRVLGRIRRKEKMTDNNKAALEEMLANAWDVDKIVKDQESQEPEQDDETEEQS